MTDEDFFKCRATRWRFWIVVVSFIAWMKLLYATPS